MKSIKFSTLLELRDSVIQNALYMYNNFLANMYIIDLNFDKKLSNITYAAYVTTRVSAESALQISVHFDLRR